MVNVKKIIKAKRDMSENVSTVKTFEDFQKETISISQLQQDLYSLKRDIDIENIQKKIKSYDAFFEILGEDTEILLEMIADYKKKKEQ